MVFNVSYWIFFRYKLTTFIGLMLFALQPTLPKKLAEFFKLYNTLYEDEQKYPSVQLFPS